jgi:CxxC motif-containing protein (DUF1111 family)
MSIRLMIGASFAMFATALAVAQTALPGGALPGITPAEFEEFRMGLDDFLEVEASEEGLGPAFNGTSCAVCHNAPAIGGVSPVAELRAGRVNERGEFETLDGTGETLFHVFARRVPIPVFGAGLVEAIPDETLRDLEDPIDRNGDGVSGRAAIVVDVATGDRRVGRFGWKAQHATLLAFGADAYRNEMGITNDLFPTEAAFGVPRDRMQLCDPFPDPEDFADPRTRRRGIDNFASFMRFLAPVAREGATPQTQAGEKVFQALGCATCHVPVLMTGPSSNPLFNRKRVELFSDLLLHDVGTGDGIRQASADAHEIRTPALWGLRFRRPLLHDGSAATIERAVLRHGQEADLARRGFEQLNDVDRAALVAFLKSL